MSHLICAAEPLATDGLDEAVAQESLRTEGGVELEPLAIEQDIGQKPKTYQDMAAAIAGKGHPAWAFKKRLQGSMLHSDTYQEMTLS